MRSNYAVGLHPEAYRDLDGIYRRAYRTPGDLGEMSRWLECLEEGILGLGNLPVPWAWEADSSYPDCGCGELEAGPFLVFYKIRRERRQVEIVAVRYGGGAGRNRS